MVEHNEQYRDRIATIDKDGKRVWVFPKKPSGKLYRYRAIVATFLIALLFIGPFLRINGKPLLLLNILERKFFIFGVGFWPQDFHIFVVGTLALIIFIVLFTVVFGRLWCGWACPQTIFMEMVFRRIEYWIEGGAVLQRKLREAPWSGRKVFKKSLKHLIFYAVSFLIGNTFLAYIIGTEKLLQIIGEPPAQHAVGLTVMILFSAAFYFVFAFFREQACTMVCPYGRLQGVLLDTKSIVVAYDFIRGEPRGKRKKSEEKDFGDCIDCRACVEVCPTGIDIRNGTQLECVNCTACIDACNYIMTRVKRPLGLIRYDSYDGIKSGRKLKLTPRIMGYSAVLILIVSLLTVMLATRNPIDVKILRTPGVLYQETGNGEIANLYNISIINKSFETRAFRLQVKNAQGRIEMAAPELHAKENSLIEAVFFISIPKENLHTMQIWLVVEIYSGSELIDEIKTSFIGPNPYRKKNE